jgi:hypothetical protein
MELGLALGSGDSSAWALALSWVQERVGALDCVSVGECPLDTLDILGTPDNKESVDMVLAFVLGGWWVPA